MNKKLLIAIGILVIVIALFGVYFIYYKPTVAKQLIESFSEFKNQYQEKKAQGYFVLTAESWAKLAKKAFEKSDLTRAEKLLNNAFTALSSDIAPSHSDIATNPTIEDELRHPYWYYFAGVGIDEKGNKINLWFSDAADFINYRFSINDQKPVVYKWKGGSRDFFQENDTIIIKRKYSTIYSKITIHPEGKRTFYFSDGVYEITLNTKPRGIPLWFGKEENQAVPFTSYGHFWGFDQAIEFKGILKHRGEITHFQGYGDYERSKMTLPILGKYNELWLCVNTPEFYGIFLDTSSPEGALTHTARVGFPKTNESFRADNFTIIAKDYPNDFKVIGYFDGGSFEFELKKYGYVSWDKFKRPYLTLEGIAKKGSEIIKLEGFAFMETHPMNHELALLHNPSIEELAKEELFGIKRWNSWFNFVGKGDDNKLYELHGTFKFFKPNFGEAWLTFTSWKEPWERENGFIYNSNWKKEFKEDKIVFFAGDENNDFVRYTIYENKYLFEARHENININLTFQKESSFWYNQGKVARVYPDCMIAGIEETSKAVGYIIIEDKKINVSGLGHSEHFFSDNEHGNIIQKINQYGNEWWIPFRSDEAKGIFVIFGNYKDAGLILNNEYVIPSDFYIQMDNEEKSIKLFAETLKGKLEMTFHIWGEVRTEYFGTLKGKLNGKEFTHGFGWVEHIK
jgi:hypothetical protein